MLQETFVTYAYVLLCIEQVSNVKLIIVIKDEIAVGDLRQYYRTVLQKWGKSNLYRHIHRLNSLMNCTYETMIYH